MEEIKLQYEEIQSEIIRFAAEDIVTESGEGELDPEQTNTP